MKKPTKFKRQKAEAVSYLSDLPLDHFNRFTKAEILRATGKEHLSSKEDLISLLTFIFDKTLTVKLNFDYNLVDIKIFREGRKLFCDDKRTKVNEVWVDVALNTKMNCNRSERIDILPIDSDEEKFEKISVKTERTKLRPKFDSLLRLRCNMIVELGGIIEMNNKLCNIFQDSDRYQTTLILDPRFKLTNEEVSFMLDHNK